MRNLIATVVVAAAMLAGGGRAADLKEPRMRDSGITVACYYFGQYHPNDPRNLKERGVRGASGN